MKILVKNIYSQLTSDFTDYEELEQLLTIAYPNYWFTPQYRNKTWDGKIHFLKIPSLKFPTGLLFIVEEYLIEKNIEYEIKDLRKQPIRTLVWKDTKSVLIDITLRDYQVEAVERAIKQGRGVLELPTASGKTEIAIAITDILDLKTLFLVNSKDLLYQTVDRFKLRLGKNAIGIIGDGKFEPEKITVATIQSIYSYLKKNRVAAKELLNYFEVMFQDECHHGSSMEFFNVAMFMHNAYFRVGMSGTALRRDVLSNIRIMAITGPPIYSLPTVKLIDEGYLSNIKIEVIDNPEVVLGDKWQSIYRDGVVRSETRNWKIVEKAEKHFKDGKRVMILVRQVEHGKILQNMLVNQLHIPAIFIWGSHEGWERERVKAKFSKEGNFILIASPIYDEGVDLPLIDILCIASGGKSEWKTIQKVGRGLRKSESKDNLLVYDFYDHSKFLIDHSEERINIYRKEGWLGDQSQE